MKAMARPATLVLVAAGLTLAVGIPGASATVLQDCGESAFLGAVASGGIKPGGEVVVGLGSRTKTATLTSQGTVALRIVVPHSAKRGTTTVRVSYGGDACAAAGSAIARNKVTR